MTAGGEIGNHCAPRYYGSWGMGGVGGSLGYGCRMPRAASFGYVTARMGDHSRAERCADAFGAALLALRSVG
jgi:hypothetical protein